MRRVEYLELFSHFLFWILFAWVTFKITLLEVVSHIIILENSITNQLPNINVEATSAMPFILIGLVVKIIVFYTIIVCFLKNKNQKKQFFVFSFILIATGLLGELFLDFLITNVSPSLEEVHLDKWMPINIGHYIILMSFTTAYLFFKQWYRSEKEKKIIENENLKTQLRFLKAQLNPHFLFNTLNNFFSVAKTNKNHELANGISKLSSIMRYMLYETDVELIPLDREIKHIQDYMELEQFRFSIEDDVITSFKIQGETSRKKIAPLILMPFIENAYKHGVDISSSTSIHISIEAKKDEIFFSIKNKKLNLRSISNIPGGGLGLINVKQRLNLIYPGKHILNIPETDDFYSIELNIKQ